MDKYFIKEKAISFFLDRNLAMQGEEEYFKNLYNNIDSDFLKFKLDVEKKSIEEKIKKENLIKNQANIYQKNINILLYDKIKKQIEEYNVNDNIYLNIQKIDFNFINSLFFKGISLSDIKDIILRNKISSDLLFILNSKEMKFHLNTNRKFNELDTAVGYIGLEKIRMLIPLLHIKEYYKSDNKSLSVFYKKIWNQQVIYSSIVFFLSLKNKIENPYHLFFISLLHGFSILFIFNAYYGLYHHIVDNKLKPILKEKQQEDVIPLLKPCIINLKNILLEEEFLFQKIIKDSNKFDKNIYNNAFNEKDSLEYYILNSAEIYSEYYSLSRNNIINSKDFFSFILDNIKKEDLEVIKEIDINILRSVFL